MSLGKSVWHTFTSKQPSTKIFNKFADTIDKLIHVYRSENMPLKYICTCICKKNYKISSYDML